ncbi:MAG: protein kinase [Anaerolineae bacterium]|nr:protein kinase [Anaerolineae bacterium]
MTDFIGQTIGQYKITGKIGEGGMAVVYRAYQEVLDRDIALKVLPPELTARNATFVQRFLQEARAAAKMDHPNIVAIYEVGQLDNVYYIAMPYVKGTSLANLVAQGEVPPARLVKIINQIAEALDYAHRRGIIHRDVKPANILIAEHDRALLADFGIAKAAEQGTGLTRTGMMVGTPAYMAPEQAKGQTVVPQTDQYALGIVTYEGLTGKPPFSSEDSSYSTLYKHVHEPIDLTVLPAPYQSVLQRALAKEPGHRFSTVSQFGQALQHAAQGQVIAYPTPATPLPGVKSTPLPYGGTPLPFSPPAKKKFPAWIWGGGIAMVVVTLILLLSFFSNKSPAQATDIQNATTMALAVQATKTAQLALVETGTVQAATQAAQAATEAVRAATESARDAEMATQNAMLATLANQNQNTPVIQVVTATATDTPVPTDTPTAAPTLAPTLPSPTINMASGPSSSLLQDFESENTWRRGDQPNGEFHRSSVQKYNGHYAGQLMYRFPGQDNDFVVFQQSHALPGQPNAISAWVYGDGSGHYLNVWVKDAKGQVWQAPLGQIEHTGWQKMTAWLDPKGEWPHTAISGPDNGAIDYPLSFNALVLDDIPDSFQGQGAIYIDDVSGETKTAADVAEAIPQEAITATITTPTKQPPGAPAGRIAFPVDDGVGHFDIWVAELPNGKPFMALQRARQPSFFKGDGRLLANGQDSVSGQNNIVMAGRYFDQIDLVSDSPTDEHPYWDPDGTRFVYGNPNLVPGRAGNSFLFVQCSTKRPQYENAEECKNISTYGIITGPDHELVAQSPVWTTDGKQNLAFRRMGSSQDGIYLIGSWATPRDGGGLKPRLLLASPDALPSDTLGENLYFSAGSIDGNWEAYAVSLEGGAPLNLSNSPSSNDGLPTVSPDGQWVAFVSDRDGVWGIWLVPAVGGKPQKLFDFPSANPWGSSGDRSWTTERISWGP